MSKVMTSREFRAIVKTYCGNYGVFTNKCAPRFGYTNPRRMGAWVGFANALKIAQALRDAGATEINVTGRGGQYVRCTCELSPKGA